MQPTKIDRWAVVNFSARCDVRGLIRDLTRLAETKGIVSLVLTCNCLDITNSIIICNDDSVFEAYGASV